MTEIPIRHIRPPKTASESDAFGIRDVAVLLAGKDMTQELHRHDFFFVLVLDKGIGSHEIDFISNEIEDQSVFFMRPGQVHKLKLRVGCTGYLMQFTKAFYNPREKAASSMLRKASSRSVCHLEASGNRKVVSVMSRIFEEYCQKQEGYLEVIKSNLEILMIELVRNRPDEKDETKTASYEADRLEELSALLEKHITTKKKVSQYADLLSLSTYQLNAITKATVGKTGSEVIDEFIILESKRHLLATTSQINEIAYHLGYDDPSYFIRFFKKHTGFSPEGFRANSK